MRRRRHLQRAVAIVFATSIAARAVLSAPPSVELTWDAPSGADCPSASDIERAVERAVGGAHAEPIRARAIVSKAENGYWKLDLTTTRGEAVGHRNLEQSSCRAVADATAVILALMIDPASTVAPEVSVRPPSPSASASASAAPSASAADEPISPPPIVSRAGRRAAIGVGLSADAGTLPTFAIGPVIAGNVRGDRLRLGAFAAYFPRSNAHTPTDTFPTAGGSFSLLALGLEGCVIVIPPGAIGASICAGPEVDRVRGASFGVPVKGSGVGTFGALAGAADLTVPLSDALALTIRGGVVAPARRRAFVIDALGGVHTPAALAARGTIGAEWSFW